eukprot:scaffold3369_cov166-Amphora_coffeaeformis.AAC.2
MSLSTTHRVGQKDARGRRQYIASKVRVHRGCHGNGVAVTIHNGKVRRAIVFQITKAATVQTASTIALVGIFDMFSPFTVLQLRPFFATVL